MVTHLETVKIIELDDNMEKLRDISKIIIYMHNDSYSAVGLIDTDKLNRLLKEFVEKQLNMKVDMDFYMRLRDRCFAHYIEMRAMRYIAERYGIDIIIDVIDPLTLNKTVLFLKKDDVEKHGAKLPIRKKTLPPYCL